MSDETTGAEIVREIKERRGAHPAKRRLQPATIPVTHNYEP